MGRCLSVINLHQHGRVQGRWRTQRNLNTFRRRRGAQIAGQQAAHVPTIARIRWASELLGDYYMLIHQDL